ncbi:MAG: hypothetical protein JF628_09790 [Sphingomonas sp.]|nr:hypothetical protein [Sphingomonas sp.]
MSDLFPAAVYTLCFVTSGLCTYLLVRSYIATRAQLLFWSAICFLFLAANSLLVVLDILVLPDVDFGLWRPALALAAVTILLFGFIWDMEAE